MKNTATRWEYLDLCRVIAIFCVVLIHATATSIYAEPVGSVEWTVHSVYFAITRFCMPILFMVSGALMLDPNREVPIKKLYKNNILRLVTALLFWSAMYYIFLVYLQDPEFTWQSFSPDTFAKQVIGGHPDHHWFLFAMIALYLVVPLMRAITKSKTACKYFLIVWFVFQIALSNIRLALSFLPAIDPATQSVLDAFVNFFSNVAPGTVMGFAGYMVLGYYLHAYPPRVKTRTVLQALGVLGVLFTIFATYLVSTRDGATNESFYDTYGLWTLAASVGVFLTARAILPTPASAPDSQDAISGSQVPRQDKRSIRVLTTLSICSFGIYLVHDFFLNFSNRNGFAFLLPSVLSPILIALAVYALSFVVIFIIKKIPVLRDYIC